MGKYFKIQYLLLPLILVAALCIQPGPTLARHYQIRTYQEWDGMPANPVFDADQDSLGLMWFCTRVGLASYDGLHWKVHSFHPNASAQPQARLEIDSRGTFWTVSSRTPLRLSKRVLDQWQTAPTPDCFWGSYSLAGLEVFNSKDGTDRVAVAMYSGIISIWDGNHWSVFEDTEKTGKILSTQLVGARLFLATTKGLFSLQLNNPKTKLTQEKNLPAGPLKYMAQVYQSNSLWLVGTDWLGIWDGSAMTFLEKDLPIIPPKPNTGTNALADRLGGLYFGGQQSIHYFHPNTGLETMTRRNGLVAGGATGFFQDREGNIWITSTRGVSKLISRRFAGYNRESGLLEDEVSSIIQRRDGTMVFGHEGGLSFHGQDFSTLKLEGLPAAVSRVMDIEEDKAENLWIAADRRGLAVLTPSGSIRWFNRDEGLSEGVFAVHVTDDGTCWAGTVDGLFRLQNQHFERIPLPGIADPMVRRLVPGPDGSILIATSNGGIFQYKDQKFTRFLPEDPLAGKNCYTCFPLGENRLFVGTAEGLFTTQDSILVPTSDPDPVINRPVYSILEDTEGNFWFGTDLGVMRWNGSELRHFTVHDGLLGNETNRDALIQTRDGNIWIGTDSGASRYNPIFDVPALSAPILEITGFMVDGQSYPSNQPLVLHKPPHSLNLLFRGFTFVDENRTYYQTKLQNFEDQWHAADTPHSGTNSINYVNLSPGKYQFLVQAIRVDGATSDVLISPMITIEPAFSDRLPVRLFLVLIALVLVWAIFAVFSGKRYARRLEKEVYQQTWELRLSEKSIKSESRRLAATLKNITDGVLAVGVDGTIVLANAAAEKILGLSQAKILKQNLDNVLPLGSQQFEEILFKIPHPNRPGRTLEVSTSSISDSDSSIEIMDHGRVVAFRDITDILQQEEERIHAQKLESLGVFAGGLAHDFNNLLTVMLGNLSILEISPTIRKPDMQMVILVREASERAQSLTRQLLTFARGGMPLLETTSISQIVREAVDFSLSGTNVSCTMDLAENLWPVEVDPGQIHQVLGNLVINAVQAMPEGGNINITIRNIGSDARRMVMVEVADEGAGISPENLSRIFDPYFTTKDLGSGLGLAMAYSIITKHGGNITVDSTLGKGTVFQVFLKAIQDNKLSGL